MWRVWYDEGGLSVGATPLILLSRARIEIPHQSMVVARQTTDADPYRHVNFAEMTLSVFLLVIFQLKLLSPSSFHVGICHRMRYVGRDRVVSDKVVVIDSTTETKFVPGYRNERRRPVEIPQLVLTIHIDRHLHYQKRLFRYSLIWSRVE